MKNMHNNVKTLNLENNYIGEEGCEILCNYFKNKKMNFWLVNFYSSNYFFLRI